MVEWKKLAYRIQNRIECRVDVSEPERDVVQCAVDTIGADGYDEENDEIGQPTNDESTHYNTQLAGGFLFLLRNEAR